MLTTLLSLRTICLAAAISACSSPEHARTAATAAAADGSAFATVEPAAARAGDSTSLLGRADRGRIRGDSTAKVWLVIVSDFQCPYCRQWHDEVFASVVRDYVATGKIRMAYLNFPLSGHKNAMPAAEAAMCASVQGRFWEMHDALFRTQETWSAIPDPRAMFDSLAVSVGVAEAPYRACIEAKSTVPMIEVDKQHAADAGVGATPTFFIGSQRVEGAVPLADFRAAVEAALASSR